MTTQRIDGYLSRLVRDAGFPAAIVTARTTERGEEWTLKITDDEVYSIGLDFRSARSAVEAFVASERQ